MSINLEINGIPFSPNDQSEIHGVKVKDSDIGIAWSDKTSIVKIVSYTPDDPDKRYDILETLQIPQNQEITKEITSVKDGQTLTTDIVIRNK